MNRARKLRVGAVGVLSVALAAGIAYATHSGKSPPAAQGSGSPDRVPDEIK
jgi:hypothetical protein